MQSDSFMFLKNTPFRCQPVLLFFACLICHCVFQLHAQEFGYLVGIPEVPDQETMAIVEPAHPISADGSRSLAEENPLDSQNRSDSERSLTDRVKDIETQLKRSSEQEGFANPLDRFKEKWNVKLGGHTQLDYVNWAKASPTIIGADDYFEFRRLRLVADGTGYGVYDFRLQMTLEPETVGETQPLGTVSSPDVKDAYLSVNEIPLLGRFRIGNFFVPFSLEQVTNDTNNIFMERSIPSQGVFSAEREVGMALYNATADKRATWTTGVFFDSISEGLKERMDDNQGCRVAGRLTWLPVYDEQRKGRYLWHTGLGVLHTQDQDNRVRFRARPQIHEGPRLIDSGVLNAQSFTTGNIETAIVWGPFTVQSEAFLSSVNMVTGDNRRLQGCYLHTSYFLTGENRVFEKFGQHGAQFGRNVPTTNFFVTKDCRGPGALELKSRWSYLDLSNVGTGQYNDYTFGLNWYWSDRTRIMFDWIHPITSRNTVFGAANADLLAMRFDFNW
jgi:phosphate-selective porin OprO and OprP